MVGDYIVDGHDNFCAIKNRKIRINCRKEKQIYLMTQNLAAH